MKRNRFYFVTFSPSKERSFGTLISYKKYAQ